MTNPGKTIVVQSVSSQSVRVGNDPAAPTITSLIRVVEGSPEGRLLGTRGDVAIDSLNGTIWEKGGPTRILTTDGWVQIAMSDATRVYHEPVLKPGSAVNSGSTTSIASNALLLTAFTLNSDGAWQQFKIPNNYVSDAAFHVHWSKTTNANDAGRNVRWRISYLVFNGTSENGAASPTVVEVQDTYVDSGTTSRIVYRTDDIPLVGFVPGYYVAVEIRAVTPTGTALSGDPGLFTLDLTYREYINQ